ncbi:MAG: ZIP family metal transporter [Candidatus Magasanikbacteria bacterium]|nr:ZIP family metal transporter [Candidatus Magasanikbacteria bacterium]
MILLRIILASLAVSLLSFVGGILLVSKKTWQQFQSERVSAYLVSFAAGVMLATAFLDVLPEALEKAGSNFHPVLLATLLGIIVFFFLERFVLWFHHHDDGHGSSPSVLLILVGDGVHNFIDGVAIAATFMTNPGLGIITTLAIAAHEIPQEIGDFSVLIHGGLSRSKALFYNFLSALTALIGAILGFFFLGKLENILPISLAFTAGMFIYIACSDLIPDLHQEFRREKRWIHSIPFIFGIVLLWFLISRLEG